MNRPQPLDVPQSPPEIPESLRAEAGEVEWTPVNGSGKGFLNAEYDSGPLPSDWQVDPNDDDAPGERLQCEVQGGLLLVEILPARSAASRWFARLALIGTALIWFIFFYLDGGRWRGLFGQFNSLVALGIMTFLTLSGVVYWLAARLGKTTIAIDRDSLEIRRSLLGLGYSRDYPLAGYSRAKLAVSHVFNGTPIHSVSVSTASEHPRFGAFLSPQEKYWLVCRINRHLGRGDEAPAVEVGGPNPQYWGCMDGFQLGDD